MCLGDLWLFVVWLIEGSSGLVHCLIWQMRLPPSCQVHTVSGASSSEPLTLLHACCCNSTANQPPLHCAPQEYTNYHLEVAPEHLKGALDRFAQVRGLGPGALLVVSFFSSLLKESGIVGCLRKPLVACHEHP